MLGFKKDSVLRFCFHCLKLNAVKTHDSYTLPRMDECLDSFQEGTLFSTVHDDSGAQKIESDECDRDKTAIASQNGLYRLKQMSVGVSEDRETLQRAIDVIPASLS